MVIASDTAHRHVEAWMKRHTPTDAHMFVTDVTSSYAQINVQGPKSRELMQRVTTADMSNEAFPFRTAREIDLGFARVLCQRITYLGELGYELYVAAEQAVHVHERLTHAGLGLGLKHAGLKALASLRMEKGYRDYGHDIDNTDSILEAGLGFAMDLKKPGGFLGKEAVMAKKAEGPLKRRIVQISELTGMENETITMQDIFAWESTQSAPGQAEQGTFRCMGMVPTFIHQLRDHGIELPRDFFA
jgi:4-methylaminobutanoate oxidase (formaldehyde-forming)